MSGGTASTDSTPSLKSYYVGMHQVLCHGPIDKIIEVQSDEKIAWTGDNTGGLLVINSPDLYGGMNREGGIQGPVDILMGLPSQSVNDYLLTLYGHDIPAFRGVVSAVLRQIYIGLNYYIKALAWKCSRIHIRKNGIPQWQDTYAQVPSDPTYTYISTLPEVSILGHTGSYSNVVFTGAHDLSIGSTLTVSGATDGLYNGTFVVDAVGFTTTTCSYIMSGVPSANAVGPIRISKGNIITTPGGLINAVHVLRDCLTDNTWGYGINEGLIYEADWLLAAQTCYHERLGFSWLWETGTLEDFINDVLTHIQGNIYQDHVTGLYHLKLVRKLTSTTGLLTLNANNTNKITDFHIKSIGELVSSVTVKYLDNITNKEATSPPAIDVALAQRQIVPIEKVVTYSGVATVEVAQKLALRDLQQLSQPAYSCTIEANRDAATLHKGDAFILDRADYSDVPLIMRVVDLSLGTLLDGRITINCVQDVFEAASMVYITPAESTWISPLSLPMDVIYKILNEIPYYIVATTKGDVFAQSVPTTETYLVQAAASPTPDSIQASLWTNSGAGYTARGVLDFCCVADLAEGIDRLSTVITLTNVIDIELLIMDRFIQVDNELINVTSRIGNILTVTRGVLDTVPESHAIGTMIYGWHSYSATDKITYLVGEYVETRLTTVTALGELDVSDASSSDIVFAGRMHLPYPPGNFTIDGGYWPSSIFTLTTITLDWASRNRFSQTAGLVDYYTGSYTSEPGVTYSSNLKQVDTGFILDSFTGETGLTRTYTLTYVGTVLLTLWSVSPNGASQQMISHQIYITTGTIITENVVEIVTETGIGIEY